MLFGQIIKGTDIIVSKERKHFVTIPFQSLPQTLDIGINVLQIGQVD